MVAKQSKFDAINNLRKVSTARKVADWSQWIDAYWVFHIKYHRYFCTSNMLKNQLFDTDTKVSRNTYCPFLNLDTFHLWQ